MVEQQALMEHKDRLRCCFGLLDGPFLFQETFDERLPAVFWSGVDLGEMTGVV